MITIFTDLRNFTYKGINLSLIRILLVFGNDLDRQRLIVQIAEIGYFYGFVSLDAVLCNNICVAGQNLIFLTVYFRWLGCKL